ncbi:MAG TPA: heme lyase CcmF/NrfE family subunit [Gemmatimonadaceae bacterium]|nr:heme lyase CcmF/NrfE family subunit [Gemmatimonadaceae bacterium]
MTGALGYSAVLVALGIATIGMIVAVIGARTDNAALVRSAYSAVYTNFALLSIATLAMVYGLVTHDFSIQYVAQVGSRSTPLFYTVISLWSALEGSILFWGFVLAGYSAAVVYFNRRRPGKLVPYAAATLLGVGIFFYILLAGPANPFAPISPVPPDGPGPNPLLQNHWLMGIHPPLLYLGYVGMTVPFAFAIGALLSGEIDAEWIKLTRRWTITAWGFLSLAIMAGMWWSYEVLGWGGYWAWDPVENASFMPWLTATAFLHSVMVEERRGMLRVWNLTLIIATFLLTILGTFLTRSGVLSSVHAFTEGTIGYYFLAFISVTLLFSLVVLLGRSTELKSTGQLDAAASRETVFLINNLLLTAFTFTVLLGTLFPLVAEAVRGVKVSVGAPFFNKMTVPLCMALLFLVGVGPALPWKRASAEQLKRQFIIPGVVAVVVAVLSVVLGTRNPYTVLAFAFAAFALYSNLREFGAGAWARMKAHGESAPVALARLVRANNRRFGGYTAHIGVLMMTVAIAASSTFRNEHEVTLKRGESTTLGPWTLRLDEVWGRQEPQRFAVGADVAVARDGNADGVMRPRMNMYPMSDQPIVTPAVRSRASGDLYLVLMSFERDGSHATLRIISEPLVPWIWLGGMIVFLGAFISWWPSRGRERVRVGAIARGAAPARGGVPGERPTVVPVPEPVRQGAVQ